MSEAITVRHLSAHSLLQGKMPLLRFLFSPPGAHGVPQSYVDALLRELAKNTRRPDTLYFGGGTPALLVPAQAAALIEAANPLPGAEITLEANPDVVTPETLRGFRAAGVTRISFGVQSADDAQLRRLGRTHTAAGAAQALAWAWEAGFPEICGDIMLALPEYTNAEFDRTLALLRDGGCTHISAYLLKVEPGTAFYRNPPAGLPDGDAVGRFLPVCRAAARGLQATGSMRSATLRAMGMLRATTSNTGMGKNISALGRRRIPSLMGGGSFFPRDLAAFLQADEPFSLCADDGLGGGAQEYILLRLRHFDCTDFMAYLYIHLRASCHRRRISGRRQCQFVGACSATIRRDSQPGTRRNSRPGMACRNLYRLRSGDLCKRQVFLSRFNACRVRQFLLTPSQQQGDQENRASRFICFISD